jgi:hypothetical protein
MSDINHTEFTIQDIKIMISRLEYDMETLLQGFRNQNFSEEYDDQICEIMEQITNKNFTIRVLKKIIGIDEIEVDNKSNSQNKTNISQNNNIHIVKNIEYDLIQKFTIVQDIIRKNLKKILSLDITIHQKNILLNIITAYTINPHFNINSNQVYNLLFFISIKIDINDIEKQDYIDKITNNFLEKYVCKNYITISERDIDEIKYFLKNLFYSIQLNIENIIKDNQDIRKFEINNFDELNAIKKTIRNIQYYDLYKQDFNVCDLETQIKLLDALNKDFQIESFLDTSQDFNEIRKEPK